MKNYIITFIAGLIIGAGLMYLLNKPEIVEIQVPIKVEVPVPVIENESDTIKKPTPTSQKSKKDRITIKEIDSTFYYKWKQASQDSILRDSLVRSAIEIKTYNEKFEDDTLSINLYAKTRGDLLEYQLGYKTKPRTITLDTVLNIPVPKYTEFYVGGVAFLPKYTEQMKPSLKPTIILVNKKHTKTFLLAGDPINKGIEAGLLLRLKK